MAIPSPNMGLIIFFVITLVYFIFQYATKEKYSATGFGIYLIVLFLSQIGISVTITKELCGEVHTKAAFIYTILPWAIIFGLLNLMLLIFPGWLGPFSNTFGYFVVSIAGLNGLLGNILKSKEQTNDKDLSQTLGKIYDKPSLLINEIPNPYVGFDEFWSKLSAGGLLSSNANNYKDELRNMVRIKFIVSKFLWFALTGLLTVSTSYNYLVKSSCSTSVKEMERRHKEYERMVEQNKQETVKNERIYSDSGH